MNKIQKQKGGLLLFGIGAIILGLLLLAFGVLLIVKGIGNVTDASKLASGIIEITFGAIMCILFFGLTGFGIYATWISLSLKATHGSIKEGNIAKEGGTVNMKKCDRCGTELKDGELVCSECGKSFAPEAKPEEPKAE